MTTEQDTLVNIPLLKDLTYREWHGFINGFYAGSRWGSRQHEYEQEKHYWRGGYLVGTAMRWAIVIAIYSKFKND